MKFDNFVNKHLGERCFILGNAPSLLNENLSLLKNETVFIVNKGYNALSIGLDHYNYYVLVDERVYNTDYEDIQKNVNCTRFYSYVMKDNKKYLSGPREEFIPINKIFTKESGSKNIIKNKFPNSFDEGWGKTRSVVFDAALVAFFMGFKEIYFLGVDLYHDPNASTHFYKSSNREENSRGEINSNPQILKSIIKNISSYFETNAITITNLSKGFKYKELMKTSTLEDVINEKSI